MDARSCCADADSTNSGQMSAADFNELFAIEANARTGMQETFPRYTITTVSASTTSGTFHLAYLTAKRSETISAITFVCGSTPAAATPTLVRYGLYSVDGAGLCTLVGSTPNDTSLFSIANTRYQKSLSAPVAVVAGSRYALGFIIVTAAATPTFVSAISSTATNALNALAPRLAGSLAGQADLPASVADAALANNVFRYASMAV